MTKDKYLFAINDWNYGMFEYYVVYAYDIDDATQRYWTKLKRTEPFSLNYMSNLTITMINPEIPYLIASD